MSRALSYPVVLEALLKGGRISVANGVMRNYQYRVSVPSEFIKGALTPIGHITEKQFEELITHHILYELNKNCKDKYGTVYRLFVLNQSREEAE